MRRRRFSSTTMLIRSLLDCDIVLKYKEIYIIICSSAEVKAAGFASMDPDLISAFKSGIDIYNFSAQLYLGKEAWEKLSGKDKKMWRKRFYN